MTFDKYLAQGNKEVTPSIMPGVITTVLQDPSLPDYPWPYCGAQVNGEPDETLGLRVLRGYNPRVGDVVQVIRMGTDRWILGKLEDKVGINWAVVRSAAINPYTSGIVVFDSITEDPGGNFDTATGKFFAPIKGLYWVSFGIFNNAPSIPVGGVQFSCFLAGTTPVPPGQIHSSPPISTFSASGFVRVPTAGNSIAITGNSGPGGSITSDARYTFFHGFYFGP